MTKEYGTYIFANFDMEQAVINKQLDRVMEDFLYRPSCSNGCGYPVLTPGPCGECIECA